MDALPQGEGLNAVRAVCCVCGELSDAFEYFTEGWACQKCVCKASDIRTVYTIAGRLFIKQLKVGDEQATPVVRLVTKNEKAASSHAARKE